MPEEKGKLFYVRVCLRGEMGWHCRELQQFVLDLKLELKRAPSMHLYLRNSLKRGHARDV